MNATRLGDRIAVGPGCRLALVLALLLAVLAFSSPLRADVGGRGELQTEIALVVPAFHDLAPSLRLVYSSAAGDGWLGDGWSLVGLSHIRRWGPAHGAPTYGAKDVYALDGIDLVLCDATTAQSPSCKYPVGQTVAYTAWRETYLRIAYLPATRQWTVWRKDGTKLQYAAGHIVDNEVLEWELVSVEDTVGNKVAYVYASDTVGPGMRERYLAEIQYGGTAIRFHSEVRGDPSTYATGRNLVTARRRLATIDVQVGGKRARAYRLTYERHVGTRRSVLASVQLFGRDAKVSATGVVSGGTAMPAVRLQTMPAPSPVAPTAGPWTGDTRTAGEWGPPWPSAVGGAHRDFDVDQPYPWYEQRRWRQWFPGDVDGDGRADFMGAFLEPQPGTPPGANQWWFVLRTVRTAQDGSGGAAAHRSADFNSGWFWSHDPDQDFARAFAGDVNGDGLNDFMVVMRADTPGSTTVWLRTALSRGDGTFATPPPQALPVTWDARHRFFPGDIDGDGRSDLMIAARHPGGCGGGASVDHVDLVTGSSNGDGTFTFKTQATCWSFQAWDDSHWFTGDTNGDGLRDFLRVVAHEPDGAASTRHAAFQVAISKGDGTFDLPALAETAIAWSTYRFPLPYFDQPFGSDLAQAGDFDGDGKTDLVVLATVKSAATPPLSRIVLHTAFSSGDGRFRLAEYDTRQLSPNGLSAQHLNFWLTLQHNNQLHLPNRWFTGDTNGDGATDLVVASPADFDMAQWPTTVSVIGLLSDRRGGWIIGPPRWTNWFFDCVDRLTSTPSHCPNALQSYLFAADVDADGQDDILYAGLNDKNGTTSTSLRARVSERTALDARRFLPAEIDGNGTSELVYAAEAPGGVRVTTLEKQAPPLPGYGMTSQIVPVTPALFNPAVGDWRSMDIGGPHGRADGREDLVHVVAYDDTPAPGDEGIRIYALLSDGPGKWTLSVTVAWPGFTRRDTVAWQTMDVNGDGAMDLVHIAAVDPILGWLQISVLLAKGDGTWTRVSNPPWPFALTDTLTWRSADINGDGRADLVHVQQKGTGLRVQVLIGKGDGTWAATTGRDQFAGLAARDVRAWRVTDANGDGMVDLIAVHAHASGLQVRALLSHGNGTWSETLHSPWPNFQAVDKRRWRLLDANGDGRGDLVHLEAAPTGVRVRMLLANGSGSWTRSGPSIVAVRAGANPRSWFGRDADADGRTDLVRVDYSNPTLRVSTLSPASPLDLLTEMRTSLGQKLTVHYRPSSDFVVHSIAGDCSLAPGQGFAVVGDLVASDGHTGQEDRERFEYGCAKISARHRSFLGFQTTIAYREGVTNRPAMSTLRRYKVDDACTSQLQEVEHRNEFDKSYNREVSSFVPTGSRPPYACLPGAHKQIVMEGFSTAQNVDTGFAYDEFGNTTFLYELGETAVAGDERTTGTSFHKATGSYLVGLPKARSVYEGNGAVGRVARSAMYCYDGDQSLTCVGTPTRGLLTAKRELNLQGLADMRTTEYQYDVYGNLAATMDAQNHGRTIFFDSQYHLYPEQSCNHLGQCTKLLWDPVIGLVTSSKDLNGAETRFQYDPLGRLEHTSRPDGTKTTQTYLSFGNAALQRIREVSDDGTPDGLWRERSLDGLGRTYRTVREADKPGKRFVQLTEFTDTSPRPYRQSEWFRPGSTTHVYETYQYDGLGRPVRQTHPDGTALRWSYTHDGSRTRVTNFDEANHERSLLNDAYGRLSEVRERAGSQFSTLSYTYNAVDEPLTITDDRGNVVRHTWDLLGNHTAIADPDRGLRKFTYDLVGNIKTQTDARSTTVVLGYDALDRLVTRTYPGGNTVTFKYDEASHGSATGRITGVLDPSAANCPGGRSRDFKYDGMGRIESDTGCVDGLAKTTTFQYDQLSRQSGVVYPDGVLVKNNYDSAGLLSAVPDYVDALIYDPNGRLLQMSYTNGTVARHTYEPARKWLMAERVSRGQQTLFDATYTRGSTGLVMTSTSQTNAMTSTFVYDDLERVTAVTGNQAQTFTYDTMGNMTSNSALGAYSYPPPGPTGCSTGATVVACKRPHAVEKAGPQTLRYDDNGNLSMVLDAAGQPIKSIDWTADEQPAVVADGSGATTTYGYDGLGARVSRTRGTDVTRYYGHLAEHAVARGGLVKYIYAGQILVAETGALGTAFYHPDRLGSTRILTDANGAVTARYDYRAYGEVVAASPAAGAIPGFGFTGQRLDDGGLIYMNARWYDPQLGRFLSADPVMPNPAATQAMNRYAYGYNNPLRFVDPTGHEPDLTDAEIEEIKSYGIDPNLVAPVVVVTGVLEASFTPADQAAWDAAETANFNDASVKNLIEVFVESRMHGQGLLNRDLAERYATVRGAAFASHWKQGSLLAGGHLLAGLVESFGASLFGDTPGETAKNVAVMYAFSGVMGAAKVRARSISARPSTYIPLFDIKPGPTRLATGNLFEHAVQTPKGPVRMLGEVVVVGNNLHLKDIIVFGNSNEPLTGLIKHMLSGRTEVIQLAKDMGFEKLTITGVRVETSSSAKPGKIVEMTVDLNKR